MAADHHVQTFDEALGDLLFEYEKVPLEELIAALELHLRALKEKENE